jgi:hypothetical protein
MDMAIFSQYSIKFTVEISTSKITFLGTTATLMNREIEFYPQTIPMDSHLYLMPSSCHPPHTFKGMPKRLAIGCLLLLVSFQIPQTRKYPRKPSY